MFSKAVAALAGILPIFVAAQPQWVWQNPKPAGDYHLSVSFPTATTGYVTGVLGSILKTTDGGASWTSQFTNRGNTLYSITCSSATTCMTTGAEGEVLKTTNGGTNWVPYATGFGGEFYDMAFVDANVGYAVGVLGAIYKTTDGSATWNTSASGTTNFLRAVHFTDASTGYAVGDLGTILKTTNAGLSWSPLTSGVTWNLWDITFQSSTVGYAAGDNGVLKTTNGGTSWSKLTIATTQQLLFIKFTSATDGYVIGQTGTIFKTTNGGTNWTAQSVGSTQALRSMAFIDANNAFMVGSGVIYKTTNAGTAWASLNTNELAASISATQFLDTSTGWIAGSNGSILKTTNGGAAWISQTTGVTQQLKGIQFVNSQAGYAVGSNGTILKTQDGGTLWGALNSGFTSDLLSLHFFSPIVGLIGGSGIRKTTNGGSSWTQVNSLTTVKDIQCLDASNCLAVGDGLRKSTDGGSSWTNVNSVGGGNTVAYVNSLVAYMAGGSGNTSFIVKTTNGGTSWTSMTLPILINEIKRIRFADENVGYALGYHGAIVKTTNGGTSWTRHLVTEADFEDVHLFDAYNLIAVGQAASGQGAVLKYVFPSPPGPILTAPAPNAAGLGVSTTLSWNASLGADTYRVQVSTTADFSSLILDTVQAGLSKGIASLNYSTTYYWRVSAHGEPGFGAYSSGSFTTLTPPGAATNFVVTQFTNGNASLSWTAPTLNASTITAMTVLSTPGNHTCTVPYGPPFATSCVVNGLTNGTTYTFSLTASNAAGPGPAAVTAATTIVGPPDAPNLISANVSGNGKVRVTWNKPVNTYGGPVLGYEVFTEPGGLGCSPASDTTCEISNLQGGVQHGFKVRAFNLAGYSPFSSTLNATPLDVPTNPTELASVAGTGQVTVTWAAPNFTGGAAITSYTIRAVQDTTKTCIWTTGPLTCTVTGLTNGTPYTFTARAVNSQGTGPAATLFTAATPSTVPGAPLSLVGTPGNGQVSLAFTAPFDSGSAITQYTVTTHPGGTTTTGTVSPITVTGLTNGTAYRFTIKATNGKGVGAASDTSAAATPRTTPDAPTAPTAVAGDAQATVSWTASVSTGGATITSYAVRATQDTTKSCLWTTGALSCTVTGLTNGTAYTFKVIAINAAGSSAASAISSTVTPLSVPSAPSAVNGTPGDAQVTLTWTASTSNGGTAILGYVARAEQDTAKTCTVAGLTCSITGLTNGTVYTFTAVAVNAVGSSLASGASAQITPRTIPGAPQNVTGSAGSGQVTVSWSAPASNGGANITSYTARAVEDTAKTCTWLTGALSCTVNGLAAGTTYTFTVRATNVAGVGPASAASIGVTTAIRAGAEVFRVTGQDKPYAFGLHQGAAETVTLRILSARGAAVWSGTFRPEGKTVEITWNGRASNGTLASAGLYIARLSLTKNGETVNITRKHTTLNPKK